MRRYWWSLLSLAVARRLVELMVRTSELRQFQSLCQGRRWRQAQSLAKAVGLEGELKERIRMRWLAIVRQLDRVEDGTLDGPTITALLDELDLLAELRREYGEPEFGRDIRYYRRKFARR